MNVREGPVQTATVTCDSCGSSMPANAWSCPHCGDLNVDAEAAEFDYLAMEPGSDQSYFATPMEPGPFATPMHPWKYDDPVEAGIAGVGVSLMHLSPASPAAPEGEPDRGKAHRGERPRGQNAVEHRLPPMPAPPKPLSSPDQDLARQAIQARREHDQKVRLRPRVSQDTEQESYGYPRPSDRATRPSIQWNRPYLQYAPLFEVLAYVGLLGVGHIYAGYVKRGVVLLTGWWAWFLVAKAFSLLSNGATDSFTLLIGLLAPILSGFWLTASMWKE